MSKVDRVNSFQAYTKYGHSRIEKEYLL